MKIKAKVKEYQLLVHLKTSKEEPINEKELDRFSRVFLRGFLRPKIVKNGVIDYTGPAGISLATRFKKPLTKREYLFVLEQIAVAVQKLQANNFAVNHLVMDLNYVYINEATKELQFIYLPITTGFQNLNLLQFIEVVSCSVIPGDEHDNGFVYRFLQGFRVMRPFDIKKVEAFVAKEDRSVVNTIRKQNSGQSGFMTNKQQHYYDYVEKQQAAVENDEPTDLLKGNDDPTGLLKEEFDEATGLLSNNANRGKLLNDDATGLLKNWNNNDDATGLLPNTEGTDEATGLLSTNITEEEATGLLSGVSEMPMPQPYDPDGSAETGLLVSNEPSYRFPKLYRVLTAETILVNKPVFRLGKERSYVDYFVNNNIAVSRSHADIITRGNLYFVKDLNSKNRTFINGREIPVQMEVEIRDGDELKLGNEVFIFNI